MGEITNISSFRKLHGIQLDNLSIVELYIRANQISDKSLGPEKSDFVLLSGHTEYDKENKRINVAVKIEVGLEKETTAPYSMRVELVGYFCVDEEKFSIKHIEHWAKHNAPFILHPYLREHVYSLTSRCGFKPLILPLMETPVLTIPE